MSNNQQIINRLKTQLYTIWGAWSQTFGQPYDFIFILASARSGSTLLAHILTSNPEIFGMGESKIRLTGMSDYRRLVGKNLFFHWRNDLPRNKGERYILDKLVHNHLLQPRDIDVLKDPRVRIIFLIREPRATLASFMRAIKTDEASATEYLVQRLTTLQQYAQNLAPDKRCLLLTYRELLHCTQPALDLLQDYLQLQHPLSEQYRVTNTTGAFGIGDKSEQIRSGRIVAPTKLPDKPLSAETLASVQAVHTQCLRILRRNCLHLAADSCPDHK